MTAVDRMGRAVRWGLSPNAKSWALALVWGSAGAALAAVPVTRPVVGAALFAAAGLTTLLLFIAVPTAVAPSMALESE